MGDRRHRELERRWRESGAAEDEAAWLVERVRAGELARWRLELAARCGHAGLGGVERPPLAFGAWVAQLRFEGRRGGRRTDLARVPLAAAVALEPVAVGLGVGSVLSPALRSVAAACCGLARERRSLELAREALWADAYERYPDEWDLMPPVVAVVRIVDHGASILLGGDWRPADLDDWARTALYPDPYWGGEPGVDEVIEASFQHADGRLWALRLAMCADLVSWALGYGDPVRTRAARRGEGELDPEGFARS